MRWDGLWAIARRDREACGIHYRVAVGIRIRKKSGIDLREWGPEKELKTKKKPYRQNVVLNALVPLGATEIELCLTYESVVVPHQSFHTGYGR
jgi:hypothetical protein